jgi:glycosyltransferase involved in cell wall biosynthesis
MDTKTKTKTIVFIRNTDFTIDVRLRKAVRAALNDGIDCIVFDWMRNGEPAGEKSVDIDGKDVRTISYDRLAPFGGSMKNIFSILGFQRWIKRKLVELRNEYDAIYACDFVAGMPAIKAAKRLNKKIIYDIFDYCSDTYFTGILKGVVARKENMIINRADAVIICHESRVRQIEGTHPKKLIVIHNTPYYADDIGEQKICKGDGDAFKIVYAGTLAPCGRLLAEILAEAKNHKDIEYHFAGRGPLQPYLEALSKMESNVFFYGQLINVGALRLTKECDLVFAVYEQTNVNNQFSAPNKVYEAMAFTKPIIACCGKYIDQMIIENFSGIVINYNADEFYRAVYDLKNDLQKYKACAENGKRCYEEKYKWQIMEERLKTLYRQLFAE